MPNMRQRQLEPGSGRLAEFDHGGLRVGWPTAFSIVSRPAGADNSPGMDWPRFRAHFPVTARWAFLDHAAVAAPAGRARWRHQRVGRRHGRERRHRRTSRGPSASRRSAAWPAGCSTPTRSTSPSSPTPRTGIGIVAEGFPWQPGDNVVTAAEEYPANLYPWMNLARRGVEVRPVPSRGNRRRARRPPRRDGRADPRAGDQLRRVRQRLPQRPRRPRRAVPRARRLLLRGRDPGARRVPARRAARRRSTPSRPTGTSGCSGRRGRASPTSAASGSSGCTRSASAGTAWSNPLDFSTIDFRLKPHAGRWEGGTLNVRGITALGASLELLLDVGIDERRAPACWS